MVYVMSMVKALTLMGMVMVGEPAVCPDQGPRGDEEQECTVRAVVNTPGGAVVIMVRS